MSVINDLKAQLPPTLAAISITHFATVDSTMLVAERQIQSGRRAPFLLLADEQTAGIGRRGHHFDSPPVAGLYFTYAMPAPAATALLTPAAGVALQQTVSRVVQVTATIKWVNDLLVNDRKVAGIMATFLPEPQPTVLIGVGVNLTPSAERHETKLGLPIGALLTAAPANDLRPALLAQWLIHFTQLLQTPAQIMPAYRQHAAWLGRTVTLAGAGVDQRGTVQGFTADGALQLLTPQGLITTTTGSIRLV
ncbi:MAG: biotin--[acetyl-CoA-carboxylase] ligase [Lactobacillus sp.]|jgi:BirA family biotin operon repressor/biotin-[acetyl-CoA-carboxylase] ligase|uniref:Biotin--[acetyl-CoA-carboxylase] ligase n=1 Tax=Lacticaseibacillus suilingensis TaxID=2799577 RepID=A0ABW4BH10_9LACO|nr:biotin--[acetyl-CoA-carboxylase] ligase [Lacticaseibacillus suilingensis]MCI1893764.1 biotin--[acetyl-CoA-carboxylase] ligase [Lactobacillus sp.]MCI1918108.1 biotin--[acetyl-CoA-carboxylase] ligase [Lactobacillus sp.]MCI1941399.1 biotin--[acetyl-CoA-carboxylase] ligase [Lactobacillus sp.]MCI1971944.1 biotin--[acetyl-CoA-carboxylase] ligase [Lactobacillus sp.]MCI2017689.1 biotin--[acetyl-CoA-carboxylase] ligase [Lactobacillus sp.]